MKQEKEFKDLKIIELFNFRGLTNFPFIEQTFDAITYYQLLSKIVEYLNAVIEQQNSTTENMNELIRLYNELVQYIDTYFENLDIQNEVDKKLDEMYESGELLELITEYLKLNGIMAFNTVEELTNSTTVVDGSFCKTFGNKNYLDGLGRFYKIRELKESDIVDDVNIIKLTNIELLIAELIPEKYLTDIDKLKELEKLNLKSFNSVEEMKNSEILEDKDHTVTFGFYSYGDGGTAKYYIKIHEDEEIDNITIIELQNNLIAILILETNNVKKFGAKGDGINDDTIFIQTAIDYAVTGESVFIPAGSYLVNNLILQDSVNIKGEAGRFITKLILTGNGNENAILKGVNSDISMTVIEDLTFMSNNPKIGTGIILGSEFTHYNSANFKMNNCLFYNLNIGIDGSGVKDSEDPKAIGLFDSSLTHIWCSDCNRGIIVGGSGMSIINPRITVCDTGIVLDYVSPESYAGGIIQGGVFASNNYDLQIPKSGGIRPFSINGTWFEDSAYGILNINNNNTRLMTLSFNNCMLNTKSTTFELLNFYNGNGTVTISECTIFQTINAGSISIVKPMIGSLAEVRCRVYLANGTTYEIGTSERGKIEIDGTGFYNLAIPHGLDKFPEYVKITSNSADFSTANYYVDYVNEVEVVLSFINPLIIGVKNIKFYWEIGV